MKILIERNSATLAENAEIARSFFSRARGLIGRSSFEDGEGLVIERCNSVHMFFMSFSIDVVFCNAEKEVLRLTEQLKPWRISCYCPKAEFVLELPSGTVAKSDLRVGDRLSFEFST